MCATAFNYVFHAKNNLISSLIKTIFNVISSVRFLVGLLAVLTLLRSLSCLLFCLSSLLLSLVCWLVCIAGRFPATSVCCVQPLLLAFLHLLNAVLPLLHINLPHLIAFLPLLLAVHLILLVSLSLFLAVQPKPLTVQLKRLKYALPPTPLFRTLPVPEFIDSVFAKNKPKTESINSGTELGEFFTLGRRVSTYFMTSWLFSLKFACFNFVSGLFSLGFPLKAKKQSFCLEAKRFSLPCRFDSPSNWKSAEQVGTPWTVNLTFKYYFLLKNKSEPPLKTETDFALG